MRCHIDAGHNMSRIICIADTYYVSVLKGNFDCINQSPENQKLTNQLCVFNKLGRIWPMNGGEIGN